MSSTSLPELLDALALAPAGIALWDAQDRLRFANPWFEQTYGVRAADAPSWEQMVRRSHAERHGILIETDDIDAWIAQVRTRYRSQPVRRFESDLADGRWVWVVETLMPDGRLLMLVTDISTLKAGEVALRESRDEAVRTAMRDPLTELYNRRYIFGRLSTLLAGSAAMRWPLSVAMIDIDHFKHINDSAGHDIGDAVLCHFAQALTRELRPMDAVGRIGGEEFLLLLPNTGLDGAALLLSRVRDLVARSCGASLVPVPRYTFSAGLAAALVDDSVDTLYRRADQALYAAKQGGRDRDQVAPDSRSMRL